MTGRVGVSAVLGGCVVVVVIIGLGLGWWTGGGASPSAAPASPVTVRATLAPAQILFGDQLHATVAVAFDRAAVSPSSVRVEPGFAPYAPRGLPSVMRTTSGRVETLRYDYTLECTSEACLPGRTPLAVQFPPVVVTASGHGRTRETRAAWPKLLVSSRIPPGAAGAATPRFAGPDVLPPVRYAVPPGALADALTALAALFAVAAVAILLREGLRFAEVRRRTAALNRTPLQVALQRAREAAGRPEPGDRRKALGHLAQVLAGRGETAIAAAADEAAWTSVPPDRERMLSIVDDVESKVGAEAG